MWRIEIGDFDRDDTGVEANQTSEIKVPLALLLLVAGILADDADDILPLDDLAAFAETFDGGSDFHGFSY